MKTKHQRNSFFFFLLAFTYLAWSMPMASAADLQAPQRAIEDASNQLKMKLQDPGFTKDFGQITQFVESVIYPHVDFNRISALVLGKLWKEATPEQKVSFKKEFQTLLIRTYSRAFVEFNDWTVRYLPLKMENDTTKVVVKTEILQPGIQPIGVDYRMLLDNGEWKTYDILIEGVSLVTNYRTTFSNEYKTRGSLAAVIEALATKNSAALAENKSDKS